MSNSNRSGMIKLMAIILAILMLGSVIGTFGFAILSGH